MVNTVSQCWSHNRKQTWRTQTSYIFLKLFIIKYACNNWNYCKLHVKRFSHNNAALLTWWLIFTKHFCSDSQFYHGWLKWLDDNHFWEGHSNHFIDGYFNWTVPWSIQLFSWNNLEYTSKFLGYFNQKISCLNCR